MREAIRLTEPQLRAVIRTALRQILAGPINERVLLTYDFHKAREDYPSVYTDFKNAMAEIGWREYENMPESTLLNENETVEHAKETFDAFCRANNIAGDAICVAYDNVLPCHQEKRQEG